MIRKIKEIYTRYKAYVRVDLIMYGVWILLIILFIVYNILSN